MIDDVLNTAKEKMAKTCSVYQRELQSVRAGRANPQLLDRIMVDYYGTPTPINQVGNVSVPEARLMIIAPWEPKMITPIEKAKIDCCTKLFNEMSTANVKYYQVAKYEDLVDKMTAIK